MHIWIDLIVLEGRFLKFQAIRLMFDSNVAFNNPPYSWGFSLPARAALCICFPSPIWKSQFLLLSENLNAERAIWPLFTGFQAVSDLMLGCGFFFYSFGPLNSLAPTSFVAVSGAKRSDTKAGVTVCAAHSVEKPRLDFSLRCSLFKSSLGNDFFRAQFLWHWYILLKMFVLCNYSFNYFNKQIVRLRSTGFGL